MTRRASGLHPAPRSAQDATGRPPGAAKDPARTPPGPHKDPSGRPQDPTRTPRSAQDATGRLPGAAKDPARTPPGPHKDPPGRPQDPPNPPGPLQEPPGPPQYPPKSSSGSPRSCLRTSPEQVVGGERSWEQPSGPEDGERRHGPPIRRLPVETYPARRNARSRLIKNCDLSRGLIK